MTFLYPLGLLGLIGVPIVILIYILRNKFNEQTVASTYLWTLSEKFFKRRNPLSGLTGLISLILQILTIITVSLAIARPVFTIPNSASEYCFVLDASGSMNMKSGLKTRFEQAKDEIEDIIGDAKAGSTYTLICAADETTVTYERLSDKKLALDMLSELSCSDGAVKYAEALSEAQKYFDENSSSLVYLFTDKDYAEHENVEVVKLGTGDEENYALSDVSGTLTDGILSVTANVVSHTSDAELKLELYIDDGKKPAETAKVSVKKGEPAPVALSHRVENYESFRLVITNKDNLATDNEVVSYNLKSEESYSILIVSETPFFLEAVFDVLTDSTVDTVSPEAYAGGYTEGDYGLYIFHSYTPDELPDAAIWLINSNESVDDSGFGIRGTIELDGPGELQKSASTATAARNMLEGVDGRNIFISEYVKYSGMYTKFTTLFSYDSNPLIFAGVNALGNREVVFGFDLHKSDFAISSDFTPLLQNLLEYSCPDVLERANYMCGEDVEINITANMRNVKVLAPNGEEIYIDSATDIGVLGLDQVGTYTISMNASGVEKLYRLYSSAPAEEGVPSVADEAFSIVGEQGNEKTDGEYDMITVLFICLALIFIADWMVYCYEKYQLR